MVHFLPPCEPDRPSSTACARNPYVGLGGVWNFTPTCAFSGLCCVALEVRRARRRTVVNHATLLHAPGLPHSQGRGCRRAGPRACRRGRLHRPQQRQPSPWQEERRASVKRQHQVFKVWGNARPQKGRPVSAAAAAAVVPDRPPTAAAAATALVAERQRRLRGRRGRRPAQSEDGRRGQRGGAGPGRGARAFLRAAPRGQPAPQRGPRATAPGLLYTRRRRRRGAARRRGRAVHAPATGEHMRVVVAAAVPGSSDTGKPRRTESR